MSFDDRYQQRLVAVRAASDYAQVQEAVEALAKIDLTIDSERYFSDLRASLEHHKRNGPEVSAVRYYFAGTEIEPWVPSMAWTDGYSGYDWDAESNRFRPKKVVFHEAPAFDLHAIDDHLASLAQSGRLADLEAFDDLKWLFVEHTFRTLRVALGRLVDTSEFRSWNRPAPFRFFATGGHDEATELLLET